MASDQSASPWEGKSRQRAALLLLACVRTSSAAVLPLSQASIQVSMPYSQLGYPTVYACPLAEPHQP